MITKLEQPLPDSTSCNLGSINVSEFVKDGYFDIDSFKEQILRAVYYLDLVIDATRYPLPEIEQRTKAIRPIGLGIMGLADLAIKLNIRYGSKDFIFLCEEIGRNLASMSLYGTITIAKIKESYDEFKNITLPLFNSGIIYDSIKKSSDKFIEPKNPFDTPNLKQIINANEDVDTRIKIYYNIYNQMINDDNLPFTFKNALEALYIDQGGDCSWLYDMFTHGLRNSRRLSIAPTGTISLILNTSSSIEPNFAYEWTRTVTVDSNTKQDMKFYHKLYNEENKQAEILPCASELSVKEHVECVAEFAKWVDSGISKTVNLSNDATVDDVKKIYDYCYDNKIKGITIYRDGSRDNQPLKKETVKEEIQNIITNEEKVAVNIKDDTYNSIRVRPKIMKGLTTKSDSPYGSIYVTANFDDNNKIFETFISAGKSGSVSKSVTEAMSRVISLALRANVDINDIIKTISNISGSELWIYDTIDGKEVYVKSIPDATAKMLADLNEYSATLSNTIIQHKKDNIKETDDIELIHSNICPECGKSMIMVSGCAICTACGYSPCR